MDLSLGHRTRRDTNEPTNGGVGGRGFHERRAALVDLHVKRRDARCVRKEGPIQLTHRRQPSAVVGTEIIHRVAQRT